MRDHEANKIVGVPCATGSHTKHVVSGVGIVTVTEHIHHATWFWYDSDEDESHSQQEERVVKIACGDVPHDDFSTDITSWGNHGTVGWDRRRRQVHFHRRRRYGLGQVHLRPGEILQRLDRRRQRRRLFALRWRPGPMQQVLRRCEGGGATPAVGRGVEVAVRLVKPRLNT